MKPQAEKKRKPNLYFSEGVGFDKDAIREHIQAQIAKEETKGLKKPQHSISLKTGKLQIKRHEGALKDTQAAAKLNMASIKKSIQEKIKQPQSVSSWKLQAEKRVATGVPGLDIVMEGGFRHKSINLIGGGAGSGKSIFCMQFLMNGIEKYGENGIYISFEQTPEEIFEDMNRFGWDIEKEVKEKKLVILHYTPEQVEKVLEAGGGTVRDTIESINARRLVLDSLTAFTLLHENQLAQRRASLALFENIKKWGCTALVVSEQEPDPEKHYSDIMEFEVDGVLLLYNIRKGDVRERSLEIYKMRGVHHAAKIFPMKISDKGIEVFPEEAVF